jgi:hypothetical protein
MCARVENLPNISLADVIILAEKKKKNAYISVSI